MRTQIVFIYLFAHTAKPIFLRTLYFNNLLCIDLMQAALLSIDALKEIVNHFKINGEAAHVSSFGSGHINDTFRVINANEALPDYLLQRVNSYVFKDVPLLINNIVIVTGHIRCKMLQMQGAEPDKQVLTLVATSNGDYYYKDAADSYWRMYVFLEDTRTYDLVTTEKQAAEGGRAFGKFQSMLTDLDANLLGETIPDFHNIEWRLENFDKALAADVVARAAEAAAEIEMLNAYREQMGMILKMGRSGKLPLRITHNDTKFNNVLLNDNDCAQCVIDLDTVMPGYVAYDFGDAIRTIVNTAAEDEADLTKIDINLALFEAFTLGFLEDTAKLLTEAELNSLAMGTLLLPYIMGVRFLTDYLDGDKYYKIHSPNHNLQRARAQFQLTKRLDDNYAQLQSIIRLAAQRYGSEMLINHQL